LQRTPPHGQTNAVHEWLNVLAESSVKENVFTAAVNYIQLKYSIKIKYFAMNYYYISFQYTT